MTNGSRLGYSDIGCGYRVVLGSENKPAFYYGGIQGGGLPEDGVYED